MVKKVLDMDIREYSQDDFLKNLSYDNPITILDLMNHKADFQDTYFIQTKEASKIKSLEETLSTNQSHGYGNGKIGNMTSYMVQRAVFYLSFFKWHILFLMDLERIMIKLVRKKNIIFL